MMVCHLPPLLPLVMVPVCKLVGVPVLGGPACSFGAEAVVPAMGDLVLFLSNSAFGIGRENLVSDPCPLPMVRCKGKVAAAMCCVGTDALACRSLTSFSLSEILVCEQKEQNHQTHQLMFEVWCSPCTNCRGPQIDCLVGQASF